MIEILAFDTRHAEFFAAINRAWLDAHDLYEEADGKLIYSPQAAILDIGGEILIAEEAGRVVGSVVLLPAGEGEFELAKLAVVPERQRRGLGRRLSEQAIARARERGARRVVLSSNSRLQAAIRLYESLGFQHVPPPPVSAYETANVYMLLELGGTPAPAG